MVDGDERTQRKAGGVSVVAEIRDDVDRGAVRLVSEYRDRLYRDAQTLCRDPAAAEDLVFRTFDLAIRKIDSFKGECSLYGWMKAILHNCHQTEARRKSSQMIAPGVVDEDMPETGETLTTEKSILDASDAEVVRRAVCGLPEELREVIVLHYFMEQPVAKIARVLAMPAGTVKFRMHIARKLLARVLARQMKRPAARLIIAAAGLFAAMGLAFLSGIAPGGDPAAREDAKAEHPGESIDVFGNNEGENMMITRKVASLVGASLITVAAPCAELTSEPTFVFLRPETSSFWHTATNNVMTLPIDYPVGASSASLSVTGDGYAKTYTGLAGDSFDLELPAPNSPSEENIYDLVLSFDDGTERRARLGLIQGLGADSEGATRCLAPAEGRVWNKVKNRAVMPIPYGMESFKMSIDGGDPVEVETGLDGAQGWYALKPANGSKVSLSLSLADGVNYAATLFGVGNGFFIILK